jgi:hypothetical protein
MGSSEARPHHELRIPLPERQADRGHLSGREHDRLLMDRLGVPSAEVVAARVAEQIPYPSRQRRSSAI